MYLGSSEALVIRHKLSRFYHGRDGFQELKDFQGLPLNMKQVGEEHAVDAIRKIVKENPSEYGKLH